MNLLTSRPARLLRIAAAVLAITMIAACKKDKDQSASATPTAGVAQATPIPRPDPKTLLDESATNLEGAKSFHYTLEHERGTTPIVLSMQMTRAEGDVVRPDRLRADVDATLAGQKLKFKLVSVGDNAKITNPLNPNRYQPLPEGTKVSNVFDPAAGASAALRNAQNPQITGEDTIDGRKVWKVEGNVDAATLKALTALAEPGYIVKGTAWVGQETKQVYRIRLEGPLGSDDNKDVVRVMTLSRYNDAIEITPVP